MKTAVLFLCVLSSSVSGCMAHTATPATHGKAYVVVGSLFGSDTYYCEAKDGAPECWQVVEEELPEEGGEQ
ncbi:MAG: hypothetical protein JRI68_03640 [Deltaproteobacteria bacterium]|nr:hypothetical protein [Deltaproteobacteria bacterium]